MIELWLKSNKTGVWESLDTGADVSISITESDQECVDAGNMNNGCLLSIDKTSGKIGINVLAIPNFNNIIKIRTESIDETKIDM